jgi:hypothetical protein
VIIGRSASPDLESAAMQTARNVAIILALAAAVNFLPGGGEAADAILAALTMIFFAAIAWMVYRLYREQQMTLATLSDARRAGLFGAAGGIALLVVAYDDFVDWTGGFLLWLALVAGCIAAIFLIWRSATTYY